MYRICKHYTIYFIIFLLLNKLTRFIIKQGRGVSNVGYIYILYTPDDVQQAGGHMLLLNITPWWNSREYISGRDENWSYREHTIFCFSALVLCALVLMLLTKSGGAVPAQFFKPKL